MNFKNTYVFDLETYKNLLVFVANSLEDESIYHKFVVGDVQNDYDKIMGFLKTRPTLISFNGLTFDSQILELMWRSDKQVSPAEICDFIDDMFKKREENRFHVAYSEWDLSFPHLDVFAFNNYQNPSRMTSLKWLEHTLRLDKMVDLPFPVGSVIPPSSVSKVVSYCKQDCDALKAFFKRCLPMVTLRKELAEKFGNPRIYNMADSSIGEYLLKEALKKHGMKEADLKKTIPRKKVVIKDILLDYIVFKSEEFNTVLNTFRNMTIENINVDGLKNVHNQVVEFKGDKAVFGVGGIHLATKPGVYKADDDYVIASVDCKSYYPFLSIVNGFAPEHLGKKFCDVYKDLYNERLKYAKGTAMNFALKIALNAAFGKSNNQYSFLYDPKMTLAITINGQLLLAMLAEELSNIGQLLMVNTDGMEIRLLRKDMDTLRDVCAEWEALTGLELEYGSYKLVVLKDVNNYIAVTEDGKAKRKGLFQLYQDYTGDDGSEHTLHGAPNGTIIPRALFDYFVNGIPPEETINNCNDVFEFAYGIKGRKNFEYWLISADEEGVTDIETRSERAVRFIIKKRGANLYKFWLDDRRTKLQSVKKGFLVETVMSVKNRGEIITIKKGKKGEPSTVQVNYEPNRDFYIGECVKIINEIESGEKTEVELISEPDGYSESE